VSGFAARDRRGIVRVVLYTHHAQDTQSRSEASFNIALDVAGLAWPGPARVTDFRLDRDHNSPFRLLESLRERPAARKRVDPNRLSAMTRAIEASDRDAQLAALAALDQLDAADLQMLAPVVLKLAGEAQDVGIRAAARETIKAAFAPKPYSRADVERIQAVTECKPTRITTRARQPNGRLRFSTQLAGNGCAFIVIKPDARPRQGVVLDP
jgi:hypothetical protein